jgi:DNA-binding transcriptional LysR family regulator
VSELLDANDLQRVDLNLLISLEILLQEQNVSRAAQRLHITQPAMSKTLSRLRAVFNDPLVIRHAGAMQPTPRALALQPQLTQVLQQVRQLVSPQVFDPATYQGELTIALSEYIGIGLLPILMGRLQFLAPGMTLKTITRVEQQLDQLATGKLDFAIHIRHAHYGDDFLLHNLGGNPPAILAREGHPLTGERMHWERILDYPIIRLYISDFEELAIFQNESSFGRIRDSRPGSFETSHLLTALEVLRNTDYLMPGPPWIVHNPTVGYKIQALPFPAEVNYTVEYCLARHRRTENSPAHNWLWEQMVDIITELSLRRTGAD